MAREHVALPDRARHVADLGRVALPTSCGVAVVAPSGARRTRLRVAGAAREDLTDPPDPVPVADLGGDAGVAGGVAVQVPLRAGGAGGGLAGTARAHSARGPAPAIRSAGLGRVPLPAGGVAVETPLRAGDADLRVARATRGEPAGPSRPVRPADLDRVPLPAGGVAVGVAGGSGSAHQRDARVGGRGAGVSDAAVLGARVGRAGVRDAGVSRARVRGPGVGRRGAGVLGARVGRARVRDAGVDHARVHDGGREAVAGVEARASGVAPLAGIVRPATRGVAVVHVRPERHARDTTAEARPVRTALQVLSLGARRVAAVAEARDAGRARVGRRGAGVLGARVLRAGVGRARVVVHGLAVRHARVRGAAVAEAVLLVHAAREGRQDEHREHIPLTVVLHRILRQMRDEGCKRTPFLNRTFADPLEKGWDMENIPKP